MTTLKDALTQECEFAGARRKRFWAGSSVQLYHCVYFSERRPIAADDFAALVKDAQKRNAKRNLTGALLVSQDHYFQVIEGQRKDISSLMKSIMNDKRHANVTIVLFQDLTERMFTTWSMEAVDLSSFEASATKDPLLASLPSPSEMSGPEIWNFVQTMSERYALIS